MAQQVEHFHGKEGVPGSNPGSSSNSLAVNLTALGKYEIVCFFTRQAKIKYN